MTSLIGLVLIVFGTVGFIGCVVGYGWLMRPQGPVAKLKARLLALADQLHQGRLATQQVLELATQVRSLVDSVQIKAPIIVICIQILFQIVSNLAQFVLRWIPYYQGLQVPLPGNIATTTIPQMSANLSVVTGVRLDEARIPGTNITAAIPPVKLDKDSLAFSLGPIDVVSGITFTNSQPLQPLAGLCAELQQQLQAAAGQINQIGQNVQELGTLPAGLRQTLDQLITQFLAPLPPALAQASVEARQAANSPWLTLGPLLGLGYLALMHVAFALAGIALLFT